ncbi:MAG: D-2-hydroxyacid dehydrogenase [Pseudomonadota bacterium]
MNTTPRILIHADNAPDLASLFSERFPDTQMQTCQSNAELREALPKFAPDVVYSVRFDNDQFPTEALMATGGPSWISVGGSGCDHLGKWDTQRVSVTNSAGVGAAMMAEFVFGCVMHFTLDINGLMQDKSARVWRGDRMVVPLRGKTILIVGMGQTGHAVARRARAFGMHVIATRSRPAPSDDIDEVFAADDLPSLWPRADVICICVPLLPSTRGLVDAEAFAAMKPTAILVDVSRGGVIVPQDAISAMKEGRIAGAAFDVFHEEPLSKDSPYWDLPDTILSPHASAVYEGWDIASFEMFMENFDSWQRGEALKRIVDPMRGY